MNALPRHRLPLAYVLTAATFLAMDAVWLTLATDWLYRPAIGHLMAPTVTWGAAVLFYALYIAGLVIFAVSPSASPAGALGRGALLGLMAYGAYDLTNQATLQGWPWKVTLIDLVWGATVSGVSSAVSAAAIGRLNRRASTR